MYLVLPLLLDQLWGPQAHSSWPQVSSSMKQRVFRAFVLCRIPPQMPGQPEQVQMQRHGRGTWLPSFLHDSHHLSDKCIHQLFREQRQMDSDGRHPLHCQSALLLSPAEHSIGWGGLGTELALS